MSTKDFRDAEKQYLQTKHLKYLPIMLGYASSFEEIRDACKHIIESGMFNPNRPEGYRWKKRERVDSSKLALLCQGLHRLRKKARIEVQLIELCELAVENPFWRAVGWDNHGNDPSMCDIFALREAASSFKGYLVLYRYDIIRRSKHLEYLKKIAATPEHQEILEQLSA